MQLAHPVILVSDSFVALNFCSSNVSKMQSSKGRHTWCATYDIPRPNVLSPTSSMANCTLRPFALCVVIANAKHNRKLFSREVYTLQDLEQCGLATNWHHVWQLLELMCFKIWRVSKRKMIVKTHDYSEVQRTLALIVSRFLRIHRKRKPPRNQQCRLNLCIAWSCQNKHCWLVGYSLLEEAARRSANEAHPVETTLL